MASQTILLQEAGNWKPALKRGARLKCPCCGQGKIFRGYLKVADSCDSCGLDLTPQRADDGPAYIVVSIVANLMGISLIPMFSLLGDKPALIAIILGLVAIVLSLALLPPVKGMFVALQWVKGMYGFDRTRAAATG